MRSVRGSAEGGGGAILEREVKNPGTALYVECLGGRTLWTEEQNWIQSRGKIFRPQVSLGKGL